MYDYDDELQEFFIKIINRYDLKTGDISPCDDIDLRSIVDRFIKNNKGDNA